MRFDRTEGGGEVAQVVAGRLDAFERIGWFIEPSLAGQPSSPPLIRAGVRPMMACSINENVYDAKVKPGTAFTPTTRCARLDPFI